MKKLSNTFIRIHFVYILRHLLCIHCVIMNLVIYVPKVHLCTVVIRTNGMTIDMCPCMLLAAICAICYWLSVCQLWCIGVDIIQSEIYFCHCLCPIISAHALSYNIPRCGFCLTVWYLSDDLVSLIVCDCH